jgi:hypothetical protein
MANALDGAGDHYMLEYWQNGTWSTKYNLVWQSILGLQAYPQHVLDLENAFYMTKLNAYGVPLDNRATFAKADWLMWMAAFQTPDNFAAITQSLYNFLTTTPNRVPLTDWCVDDWCGVVW